MLNVLQYTGQSHTTKKYCVLCDSNVLPDIPTDEKSVYNDLNRKLNSILHVSIFVLYP